MNVIIAPVITEKSMMNAHKGKFTFVVARDAKKKEIKQSIEKLFKVHVTSVLTRLVKGQTKRAGARRVEKKITPQKRAMVELKAGEKIPLFEAGA